MAGIPMGVTLKIERAKHHVRDLEREQALFRESDPYEVLREIEAKTGDHLGYLRVHQPPPVEWSTIIGDAIHNLRSSLDHLVAGLVEKHSGRARVTTATGFPVCKSDVSYPACAKNKLEGARQEAKDMIAAVKPYPGGNDTLCLLHNLDIADKHKTLVPVVASFGALIVDFSSFMRASHPDADFEGMPPMPLGIRPAEPCLNDGDLIYRIDAKLIAEGQDDPEPSLEEAIHEPGLIECEALFPFLPQMIESVEGTIEPFAQFF